MVSAINPHFIYNTLNTSTHLAEFGRISEVVEVNDALINFLRDNLKLKSSQFYDRLENELDVLRQYIIIQNYLCDNTITLQNHVSEKDLALSIPKFLLQPLVENAILHGIVMNIDEMGNSIPGIIDITVTHSKENGRIQISVKDNGIGMSQETIQKYFSNQAIAELSEKSSMSISELRSSITAWPFSMGKIIVSRLTVHQGWERKFTLNFRSKK